MSTQEETPTQLDRISDEEFASAPDCLPTIMSGFAGLLSAMKQRDPKWVERLDTLWQLVCTTHEERKTKVDWGFLNYEYHLPEFPMFYAEMAIFRFLCECFLPEEHSKFQKSLIARGGESQFVRILDNIVDFHALDKDSKMDKEAAMSLVRLHALGGGPAMWVKNMREGSLTLSPGEKNFVHPVVALKNVEKTLFGESKSAWPRAPLFRNLAFEYSRAFDTLFLAMPQEAMAYFTEMFYTETPPIDSMCVKRDCVRFFVHRLSVLGQLIGTLECPPEMAILVCPTGMDIDLRHMSNAELVEMSKNDPLAPPLKTCVQNVNKTLRMMGDACYLVTDRQQAAIHLQAAAKVSRDTFKSGRRSVPFESFVANEAKKQKV